MIDLMWKKNNTKRNHIIDNLGIIVVGVVSSLYVLFGRSFAEINIYFPFLDFPVFIGEMIFFISCFLVFIKYNFRVNPKTKTHYAILLYVFFVILKTAHGYWTYGPLALRHAALFYYPFFCLLAYSFYNKSIFSGYRRLIIFISILAVFILESFGCGLTFSIWMLSAFLIAVVLIRNYSHKGLRYFLLILLFLIFPYKTVFFTSRTALVGNMTCLLFLVIGFYFMLKMNRWVKLLFVFICLSGSFFILVFSSNATASKTIINYKKIQSYFSKYNAFVEKERAGFRMRAIRETRLFNPEKKVIKRAIFPENEEVPKDLSSAVLLSADEQAHVVDLKKKLISRDMEGAYNNIIFRLFIWRDMKNEVKKYKPIIGFSFGRPLRSISLEILGWGEGEWSRDGWVGVHNSFLSILYRSGIVGIIMLAALFVSFSRMVETFIRLRSINGILLSGVLIGWMAAANFLLILELPYTAIPIWSLFGVTLAYSHQLIKEKGLRENTHYS